MNKLNKYLLLRIELVSSLSELSVTIMVVIVIVIIEIGRKIVRGELPERQVIVVAIVGKIKLGII